jgi:hypothetical protein
VSTGATLDDIGWSQTVARLGTSTTLGQSVTVAQVEAPDGMTNYVADTNNASFVGKRFVLRSGASGPSVHAFGVAANFFGVFGVARAVTNVMAFEANGYLGTDLLRTSSGGPENQPLSLDGARVVNHSWIATDAGDDTGEILLRQDHVVAAQRAVVCAGLNQSALSNRTLTSTLMVQAHNVLGIGLTRPGITAYFSDGGLSTTDTVGRCVVHLVLPAADTSSATALASGAAAMLIGHALATVPLTNAADPRVVRSLLLTGALKPAGWSRGFPGSSDDEAVPLDLDEGAGLLRIDRAFDILTAGRITTNLAAGLAGWDLTTVAASRTNLYFIDVPSNSLGRVTATLAWNRRVTITAGGVTGSNQNLDLRLHSATGLVAAGVLARSTSTVGTVEHLHATNLAPGRYAFAVLGGAITETNAFSFLLEALPLVSVSTLSNAAEFGAVPGAFRVSRSRTNDSLGVSLAFTGSASPGADFTAPPASVLFPAGSSNLIVTVSPTADTLAEGAETVAIALLPGTNHALAASTNATLTIADRPIDAWRFARFDSAQLLDSSVSGDAADPDGDQLENLLEYALGREPFVRDPPPVLAGIESVSGTNRLVLTFTQPEPPPADVACQSEFSTDLILWRTNASWIPPVVTNGSLRTLRYGDTLPADATPSDFGRLRVRRLP